MAATIKLMADYGCYPLWWATSDRAGDIDPETLLLSKETISRLEKWAEVYDAKLNWENPGDSVGFSSPEAEAAFEDEGISLWKQLQKELAPNYQVIYFSNRLRKVLTHPIELEILPVIQ
ncbi:hypothetical protein VF14_20620 [Nostoc linckia z18]|jgi:hypothetical protein|uniref:Uncharacterized protein n=2 Tax=Nostoc linckia TaxID=92942 RepID=A0A9Q6EKM8_NOSLI|nr:hypothetical protein [Nostoc linckia]PHK42117.1 hypothetical protein VF12_03835 [Nostoc linckia z15]PHK44068.1 hypothetical protein VF13_23790 [Nostoc linckia z16]PHJ58024.1 hypothetical protein VF02_28785 [Nostoc linckia z1]PHJ60145.1 hypothetical protein VF05_30960 [Nostoc linckia z3]PHJ65213.1 hypothetical protein VF03_28210 [Nostoc linckia z2]